MTKRIIEKLKKRSREKNMKNILDKKVKLKPRKLMEDHEYCNICGGISWLLEDDALVKCKCSIGQYKKCEICNTKIETGNYQCENVFCRNIRELKLEERRCDKAIKIHREHHLVKDFRMFYNELYEYNDGYFFDIETFEDYRCDNNLEDHAMAKYVWSTVGNEFNLDVDSLLERELEEHYEDAEDALIDVEELNIFVKEWVDKQVIISYNVDYKYCISIENED